MSSNARRPPLRTRTTGSTTAVSGSAPASSTSRMAASKAKESDEATGTSSKVAAGQAGASSTLGTRKRPALGDLTNANRMRSANTGVQGDKGTKEGMAGRTKASSTVPGSKVARAESSTTASKRREVEAAKASTTAANGAASRVTRRAGGTTSTQAGTAVSRSNGQVAGAPPASRRPAQAVKAEDHEDVEGARDHKRIKTEVAPKAVQDDSALATSRETCQLPAEVARVGVAKDEGWEDLDAEDADDPLMVAEYVNEIFHYMKEIELTTMPNGNYMDTQGEIDWAMRGVLVDWLIDTHAKFRMLPETLFLALNIVDRFLTIRTISLNKLQLVGLTAMFIAAKYEEVLCPSVSNFLYLADGGYDTEEILKAERYMLKVIGFNLSYANPMNFLRRISKADNYDIQTRTVAKYFMEISLVDYRLLEHPPSLIAAASIWMARKVLERGPWTPTLVHYSSYSEYELLGTAEIMLDYILRPVSHSAFHRKYAAKKFMRASNYVVEWAKSTYPDAVVPDEESGVQDLTQLRLDLFAQEGLQRPAVSETTGLDSRSVTPLVGEHE